MFSSEISTIVRRNFTVVQNAQTMKSHTPTLVVLSSFGFSSSTRSLCVRLWNYYFVWGFAASRSHISWELAKKKNETKSHLEALHCTFNKQKQSFLPTRREKWKFYEKIRRSKSQLNFLLRRNLQCWREIPPSRRRPLFIHGICIRSFL